MWGYFLKLLRIRDSLIYYTNDQKFSILKLWESVGHTQNFSSAGEFLERIFSLLENLRTHWESWKVVWFEPTVRALWFERLRVNGRIEYSKRIPITWPVMNVTSPSGPYVTSTISYDQFWSDSQAEILKPSRWKMLKPDFSIETLKIADSQVCHRKALRRRLTNFVS